MSEKLHPVVEDVTSQQDTHPHLEQYPNAEQDPARAEAMARASKYMAEYAMGLRDAKSLLKEQIDSNNSDLSDHTSQPSAHEEGMEAALAAINNAKVKAKSQANRLAEDAGEDYDSRQERQRRSA